MERISRQTDTPSPSGSRTSSTATSGRSTGTRASADCRRPCLSDHVDIGFSGQQVPHAAPDDLVIVEEEHADPRLASAGLALRCSRSSAAPSPRRAAARAQGDRPCLPSANTYRL